LTSIIADNNLDICPSELHEILHNCLRNQYESSIDDVGFGGGPSADGTDIDPIDFSMDHYLRLLDDEEFVGACLMGEGISYSDEDISEDDVELICAIKQFFPEDNVQEIRSILNANCGPTSGVECKYAQLYCLDRLRDFKERYGVEMSYAELEEIAGGACNASDEDYDDEVVDRQFENLYPSFHEIYNLLGEHTIEEKLNFMFGEAPDLTEYFEDPPRCEGCSVGEAQQVWDAEIRAVEMLDCILDKFSTFNGETPIEIKDAMETYFNSSSAIVVDYVAATLRYIRFYPYGRTYEAQNLNQGFCDSPTIAAWTYPLTEITAVKLCRPYYWQLSNLDQAETLIHEWTHLLAGTGDWAYDHQPEFQELNTLQSITNADSYSSFIKFLCP